MKTAVRPSIASLLPIRTVGPGYMALRRPDQLVAVFKIRGGLCPWIDDESTIAYKLQAFDAAMTQLRPGEEVQFFTRRTPLDPEKAAKRYTDMTHENAPEIYRKGYSDYFQLWLKEFIVGNRLCDYETYVLFTMRGVQTASGGLINLFGKGGDGASKFRLDEVLRRSRSWAAQLSAMGIQLEEMAEQDIYKLLYEELTLSPLPFDPSVFNRGAATSGGPDGAANVREMLATVPWDFSDPEHFRIGRNYGRVLPVSEFPDFNTYPLFLASLYQQPQDFRVSLFVRGIDQERAKLAVERQMKADMSTADKGNIQNFDSLASFQERQAIMEALSRRETALVRFSLYITILAEDKNTLKSSSDSITRHFTHFHRSEGIFEQRELFCSQLPTCRDYTPHHNHLSATGSIQNCIHFFNDPLVNNAGIPLGTSQGNQLVSVDPWGKELSNWNFAVFGIAGKGKSFGINQLIIRQLPANPFIMIIDKSGSYEFVCKTAGGRYLKMNLKNEDNSLNVFEYEPEELARRKGEVDPEQITNILGFLDVICTDPGDKGLPNLDLSILEDAIKRTYKRTHTRRGAEAIPLLRDLKDTLDEMTKEKDRPQEFVYITQKYAEILRPYIKDGIYANLTDRRTNVEGEPSFVVFDTSLLPDNEKLNALAVYIISQYCLMKAKLNKLKNRRSWLILDEAWTLAQFPAGVAFLLRIAKTSRHLALSSIFASQQVSDFLKNEDVKPVLDNASMKFLLGLGETDIPLAQKLFEMNASEIGALKGLQQIKGEYSQAFVLSSGQRGVVNITPDDLSYVIATTYPPERVEREHYITKYAPEGTPEALFKALSRWATDRRNGSVEKP